MTYYTAFGHTAKSRSPAYHREMASRGLRVSPDDLNFDEYVAAIDFGTSCCSLAFSLKGGERIENLTINENHVRVPTAILLKKNDDSSVSVVDIGFVAQEQYKCLPPAQFIKRIYFECFKMQLRDAKVSI